MEKLIEAVIPALMSRDVAASLAFYEKLGFVEVFRDQADSPRYAAVARDGLELQLQWQDPSHWDHVLDRPVYRFYVSDVERAYAEFLRTGAIPASGSGPWCRPGDTPWGTREFHVRDPDGNGLQFYRAV